MILVDANLLVYAFRPEAEEHERARAWLEDRFNGQTKVGLPWHSLFAFVRLMTNPRINNQAGSLAQTWGLVREWLELPPTWVPLPTDRHAEIAAELFVGEVRWHLVSDVHLAALAIEHGLILCSADSDFGRFEGLRWENPLRAA